MHDMQAALLPVTECDLLMHLTHIHSQLFGAQWLSSDVQQDSETACVP